MVKMEKIRNIVFASQGGTGKSSLIAAILKKCKVVDKLPRKEEYFRACDYLPEEVDRGFTIMGKVFTIPYGDYLLHILDTPGYPDFLGEVIGAMHAAEGVVMVLDASAGVEVQTERVWEFVKDKGLPRVVFANKLDREGADLRKLLQELEEKLGEEFLPLYYPSSEGLKFVPGDEVDTDWQGYQEKLIERVAESRDELVEKYLEEGSLGKEEIEEGMREEVQKGKLNLVIPGSVWEEKGIEELLDFLVKNFPSPQGRKVITQEGEEISGDENGPFVAQVFKSVFEPHLGDLSLVRIFRGKLTSGAEIINSRKGNKEKIGQIIKLVGKNRKETSSAGAGEIIALLKLKETAISDTLSDPRNPVVLEPIKFPTPLYSIAIRPRDRKDEEKISFALAKICQEEPTLHVEVNHEFGQTILSGMGELQLNLSLSKLSRYGVNVITEDPRVPYRETLKTSAKAQGKYKRQTGGRGQYGDCWIELVPLERGKGFEFENRIFGGAIPSRFIPAVEKGIREAMKKGLLAGYPVVDVKVILYDGSYHPVDSSDIAFQIAGSLAFKNAYPQAQPTLLEPIMKVEIKTPEEYLGDITGDLNARRGKILSIDADGKKRIIKALVPQAELLKYATELKSMTQGRGTFTLEFSHYEEVPQHIQARIIQEYQKAKEAEEKS